MWNSKRLVDAMRLAFVGTTAIGAMHGASAIQIDTGNSDVAITWDNTIRYNAGLRVEGRDSKIGNSANTDEGDYSFNRRKFVTNRIDLLSELGVDYQKRAGFRLSAAAWFDKRFDRDVKTNPALAARGSYTGNRFSNYVHRYYGGPSGEVLDAYVYGNFDLAGMGANVKFGRHTVLWGEAIALSAHSVSYAQAPTDARKALATPGVDAKETALPIGQLSAQLQVLPDLSVGGQYFVEWNETRIPEGGTYLAGTDFLLRGPDRFSLSPALALNRLDPIEPKNRGDWGLNARWSPAWLDGTLGVYVRQFDERSPWVSLNPAGGTYRAVYAENAKLFGLSLSKIIGGLSTGAELAYRTNTALNSTIANGALEGAKGDTFHFLLNGIQQFGQSGLWSTATLTAELGYSRLKKVTSNPTLYNDCNVGSRDTGTGCSTRSALQGFVRFSPIWYAVVPGWDLSAVASVLYGLKGNSAVLGGGNRKVGSYTLGATLDYNAKHQFSLAYNDYLATYRDNGTSITASNGSQIQDRGWLSFTYKAAF